MVKHFCDVCGSEIPYTIASETSRILYTPAHAGEVPTLMFSVRCSMNVDGQFKECILCANCLSKNLSEAWVGV